MCISVAPSWLLRRTGLIVLPLIAPEQLVGSVCVPSFSFAIAELRPNIWRLEAEWTERLQVLHSTFCAVSLQLHIGRGPCISLLLHASSPWPPWSNAKDDWTHRANKLFDWGGLFSRLDQMLKMTKCNEQTDRLIEVALFGRCGQMLKPTKRNGVKKRQDEPKRIPRCISECAE